MLYRLLTQLLLLSLLPNVLPALSALPLLLLTPGLVRLEPLHTMLDDWS